MEAAEANLLVAVDFAVGSHEEARKSMREAVGDRYREMRALEERAVSAESKKVAEVEARARSAENALKASTAAVEAHKAAVEAKSRELSTSQERCAELEKLLDQAAVAVVEGEKASATGKEMEERCRYAESELSKVRLERTDLQVEVQRLQAGWDEEKAHGATRQAAWEAESASKLKEMEMKLRVEIEAELRVKLTEELTPTIREKLSTELTASLQPRFHAEGVEEGKAKAQAEANRRLEFEQKKAAEILKESVERGAAKVVEAQEAGQVEARRVAVEITSEMLQRETDMVKALSEERQAKDELLAELGAARALLAAQMSLKEVAERVEAAEKEKDDAVTNARSAAAERDEAYKQLERLKMRGEEEAARSEAEVLVAGRSCWCCATSCSVSATIGRRCSSGRASVGRRGRRRRLGR